MRPEHVRGPVAAVQRVLDVDGDPELHAGQPRIEAADIHGRDLGERSAAEGHNVAGGVQRFESEGPEGAAAAVAHGRTAHAEHDFRGTGVQRGSDQLATAITVGAQRVGRRGLHVCQPGGLRRFDHSGGPAEGVRADGPRGTDRSQNGANHCVEPFLVAGRDSRLKGAFAAVRHRKLGGLGVRVDAQGAFGNRGGGFDGGEGALELVRGDEDAHGSILPVRPSGTCSTARRRDKSAAPGVTWLPHTFGPGPGRQRTTPETNGQGER